VIVDVQRLNNYMSNPQWSLSQQAAAKDVLDGLESTLESALGTYITPRTLTERAAILSGGLVPGLQLVATRHPVASVISLDGTAVADPAEGAAPGFEQVLPEPWVLAEHRVRRDVAATSGYGYGASVDISSLNGWPGHGGGEAARISGYVSLVYRAGWGDVGALRKAIMDKARAVMHNTHDDTVVMRETDGAKPPPVPAEDWTDAEMAKLGIFRNLAAYR
jgi:hypothetical protein